MTDMETAREIADGMKAAISSEDARELLKTRIAAALAKVREECAVKLDKLAELSKHGGNFVAPAVYRHGAKAIRTQNNGGQAMSTRERAREEVRAFLFDETSGIVTVDDLTNALTAFAEAEVRRALDHLHMCINALGGAATQEGDEHYNAAILDALQMVEDQGGMDPLQRRALSDGEKP